MPLFDPNRITHKKISWMLLSLNWCKKKVKKNSCQVLRNTIVRSIRSACYVVVKGARAWWWCSCYARISTKMVFCACVPENPLLRKTVRVSFGFLRFCYSQYILLPIGNIFRKIHREVNQNSRKFNWSKTKLRQPTGQTFFPTFPKEFSNFLQN